MLIFSDMLPKERLYCADNGGGNVGTSNLESYYRQNWKYYHRHYRMLPSRPAHVSKLLKTLTSYSAWEIINQSGGEPPHTWTPLKNVSGYHTRVA